MLTAKTDPKPGARLLPDSLADVAFLDINDVRAAVRMSVSWVHDEVRAGRFPQPMRFGPRCTRWRLADVRAWLIDRATKAAADMQAAEQVTSRAKKASAAAKAKVQAVRAAASLAIAEEVQ